MAAIGGRPQGRPPPSLEDRFGRRVDYLRLSVTDRCDLRCGYCMPKGFRDFEEPANWLTFEEIGRLVGAFARLGVHRIRLTGGEPLLRRDLTSLVARLHGLPGVSDLSLSTNATQLARHAVDLRRAGLSRINVSLDSLRPERLKRITGRDCYQQVISGLMAARDAGLAPIKINMVAMGGVNDDELDDMAAFCIEHRFVLRLIETMPMGDTGRNAGYLSLQPVRERLGRAFGLVDAMIPGGGPARYLRSRDGRFSVGFITPISQHFCDSCNRVRLGVDGTLYMCLGQNESYSFGPLLRAGAGDTDLESAIRQAIELKPQRHEFREAPGKVVRIMAKTGG